MSVIDYLLSCNNLIPYFSKFIICKFMEYSDHAPLHIILDGKMPGQTTHKPQYGSVRRVCKWRSEYVAQCREALLVNSDRINSLFTHVTSQECLDEKIDNFTETLYDIMEPFCKTYTKKTNEIVQVENRLHNEKNLTTEANQKPWFNDTGSLGHKIMI